MAKYQVTFELTTRLNFRVPVMLVVLAWASVSTVTVVPVMM